MARMLGKTVKSGFWCACCIGPLSVTRSWEKACWEAEAETELLEAGWH